MKSKRTDFRRFILSYLILISSARLEKYKTQWTYNSADLPVTMVYPGDNNNGAGETVTFTYNPQMLLDTVNGVYYLVKGIKYDAAGRTDLLSLGVNTTEERVAVDYVYYGWDEKVNNIGQGACHSSGYNGSPAKSVILSRIKSHKMAGKLRRFFRKERDTITH